MSKRILVVDDDPDYLEVVRMQLEGEGHTVVLAESVDEAKAALEEEAADLAIVDLMLDKPDDGFALSHHFKKKYPRMPVIMVTAVMSETGFDFDTATKEERAWIKADALLCKPVRFEQLQREMSRLLRV